MSRTRERPRRTAAPAARAAAAAARPGFALDGAPVPSAAVTRFCTWAAIAIGAALGVAILRMILGPHRIGDYMAETDFYGAYAEGARLVQRGQFVPSRYGVIGPGYEVLLGLAGFVVPNLFVAAELLSLTATLATFGLWFAILRQRLDARVALAAVALYACNTFVFRYGYSATTDAVAVALQSGALYLLLARGGTRAILGAGLLAAAAFLTRYNAIYLLPAGLLAIFAGAPPGLAAPAAAPEGEANAAHPMRQRLVLAGWFAAGFFAPVVPWVLYCVTHGTAFSFQLHHNIAYEVFARAKGIPWDNYQKFMQPEFHNIWDVIAKDPAAVFSRIALNVYEHLRDDGLKLLGRWTAFAAALGLVLFALDRRARALWPVLAAAALLFLTLVPAFYSERYSLALVPAYAALGGLLFGSPRFAIPFAGTWLKPLLITLPIVFTLQSNVAHQKYAITQLPVEVLEISETLRELKRPGDKVIARKPHVAFHSGVESAPFPFADSLPGLAADARRIGARWLFFSWPEAETRPAFWHLLDTSGVVPGLTVRRVTMPHPAVLYEIGPEFGRIPSWYANDTLRAWHVLKARTLVEQNNPALFAARGSMERVLGHREAARVSLERAIGLDPNHLEALLSLGALGYETGDAALSIGALERAVTTHPESPQARIGLGWAYLDTGREAEAAAAWRAVVTATSDAITLRRMRELYVQRGDAAAVAEVDGVMGRLGLR